MSPKYSAQERLKLIKKVTLYHQSVAKVCREAGISRVLFYRWLKKYKQVPGSLTTLKPGRQSKPTPVFKSIPLPVERESRVLSPEEKLGLISRVEKGEEVTDVCREAGISRTIFYRFYKRYKAAPEGGKLEAIAPRRRKLERYWRQAPENYEQAVLSLVSQHPEYGIRNLVANLPQVAGVPIVGHHGVQNILRRNNLSLYAQRLAYAQAQVTPAIKAVSTWEQWFARLFGFAPEVRAALVRFFSIAALSAFLTVVVLGSLSYFATIFGQAAPVYRPGLFFATISLLVGMLFFIYSMKYYFTLALVLSFSSQTGDNPPDGEAGRGQRADNKEGGGWLERIFGLSVSLRGSLGGLTSSGSSTEVRPQGVSAGGLQPNLDHVKLERYPFISIHLPFYNEKKVANRILSACTSMDYPNYEVIVCDDSTDETVQIVKEWENHPKVKVIHRPTREGFKGGALSFALKAMDPKTEFVCVFDADFVPYPDTLTQFMKYYKATGGWNEKASYQADGIQTIPYQTNGEVPREGEVPQVAQVSQAFGARGTRGTFSSFNTSLFDKQAEDLREKNDIAVVAGYQWHVLNKSENWITRGVRTEYAGSYVVERPGQEILGALKIIHGSVYCMRADILTHFGWGTSITEDYELTLRIYEKGFKVIYTPYIQAPSECVSTIKRLIRQRMRWAEGHSYNTRKMFFRLFFSPHLSFTEKLEFLYISPYYLQAAFFLLGTFSWLISETIFAARLPFWTSLWGWSLVLTNFFALPLMNAVGLFLEEAEEKDYLGLLSFVALCYIVTPFQAYAAIKGFLEPKEGTWFRTPKTGNITDIFTRGRFYRWIMGIIPGFKPNTGQIATSRLFDPAPLPALNPYFVLRTANNRFNSFALLKRRRMPWLAKTALAFLLIISTTLIYFSRNIQVAYATGSWDSPLKLSISETDGSGDWPTDGNLMYNSTSYSTGSLFRFRSTANTYIWYTNTWPTAGDDAVIPGGEYSLQIAKVGGAPGRNFINFGIQLLLASSDGLTLTQLLWNTYSINTTGNADNTLFTYSIGTLASTNITASFPNRLAFRITGIASSKVGSNINWLVNNSGATGGAVAKLVMPGSITIPEIPKPIIFIILMVIIPAIPALVSGRFRRPGRSIFEEFMLAWKDLIFKLTGRGEEVFDELPV